MSGVNEKTAQGWARLVETAEQQGALYQAMIEATQKALAAAGENDTDRLEEALASREELMQRVQALQDEERQLRPKVAGVPPLKLATRLGTAKDYQLDQLQKVIDLNTKLEQELSYLKQRLAHNLEQITKLKQTAQGYRPKNLSLEGRFVDWRR